MRKLNCITAVRHLHQFLLHPVRHFSTSLAWRVSGGGGSGNGVNSPSPPPPLDGIRVIDISRVLAAPFATMILGDYGAEIIKVEHPTQGDDTRHWGPPFTQYGGMSAYFACINRNKKSITVDLKSTEGRQIIYDLVSKSDVLVENYLPGKLDSMGLGYDTISKINEKLVYCSVTGYGPDGPYKDRPGVDLIVEAMAGLMHITGEKDGNPSKVGVALTDICTGLFAHGAITSALLSRQHTGRGQKLDCSLLRTQLSCLANIASNYLIGGLEAQRLGSAHQSIVPYQTFPSADGHIVIGATNDSQFVKLMTTLQMPQIASDSRFLTNSLRVENREILVAIISERTRQKTTREWEALLEHSGVSFAPVNNIEQTFNDPQVVHLQMVKEVEHPSYGRIKLTDVPVRFSYTQPSIRLPPPLLGEHTDQVLREVLGYTKEKIEALRQAKAI